MSELLSGRHLELLETHARNQLSAHPESVEAKDTMRLITDLRAARQERDRMKAALEEILKNPVSTYIRRIAREGLHGEG